VSDNPDIATPAGDAAAGAAAARAGEPDRYLAALLAPPPQREALLALAALAAEIARIPLLVVREPLMGEIRLQWWRDALALAEGRRAGHSVADAVRRAVQSYRLPAALLDGLIEAYARKLRGGPLFADDAMLHDFVWNTEGVLFLLAARVAGLPPGAEVEAVCRDCGRAYGLARILVALPRSLSLGRIPLAQTQMANAGVTAQALLAGAGGTEVAALLDAYRAQVRDSLAGARRLTRRLPRRNRVAFLPLALVEPYVRCAERAARLSLREEARIAPLTRVLRIAAAHLLGRL
jgi:phytoene synthase